MNSDQVIEAVGKAAAAANSQELCFLKYDHWLTCMNKTEWAAWVQALAVTVALMIPLFRYFIKRVEAKKITLSLAKQIIVNIRSLERASGILVDFDPGLYNNPLIVINESLMKFKYFQHIQITQLDAVSTMSKSLFLELNSVLLKIDLRKEVLLGFQERTDLIQNERAMRNLLNAQASHIDQVICELKVVSNKLTRVRVFSALQA